MSASHPIELLLVEDDPQDLELALRALRKANISNHIRVVRDGVEAIAALFPPPGAPARTETPKLVLLDLKLPKLDGLEVLRRIKGDPTTRSIPVVVLTSSQEQVDVAESYRLGANSYIVKPVNFERFLAAVRDLGVYWLLLNQPPHSA